MNKKIIIIISAVAIIAIIIGGFIFFGRQNGDNSQDGVSLRDFFPFGRTAPEDQIPSPTSSSGDPTQTPNGFPDSTEEQFLGRLRKISQGPTAGAMAFDRTGETIVRFVDRATGHIWESSMEFPGLTRISNTTIPKIQKAVWAGNNSVILQYLREDEETVETISLRLITPGSEVTTSATGFEFTTELRQGSTGLAVLNLQRVLNSDQETQVAQTGAGSPGLETTIFGPATGNAVKKFQQKYFSEILVPQELEEPTGIVDALTREKLNELTGAKKNKMEESQDEEGLYRTAINFLPIDIKDVVYLSVPQKIFYLLEDNGGSVGFLADPDGSQRQQVFESPAKEWRLQPVAGQEVLLTTKASVSASGLSYLWQNGGRLEKILGGIYGFSTLLSPDKDRMIYSEFDENSNFKLKIFDLENRQSEDLNLFSETFAEKCVWSNKLPSIFYCAMPESLPEVVYPDIWYQGLINLNDSLWEINADSKDSFPLTNLNGIDATNLFLSGNEDLIFFTNKNDYSLWVYEI